MLNEKKEKKHFTSVHAYGKQFKSIALRSISNLNIAKKHMRIVKYTSFFRIRLYK